jgi:hypothetical protein
LWLSDHGKPALDVLQKMVQVTMMRGAQSGGVITFQPSRRRRLTSRRNTKTGATDKMAYKGIRCRVVNAKRADLSVQVRNKIQHDIFPKRLWQGGASSSSSSSTAYFPKTMVPVFAGHTRFATSSKASLEGTHPQQWCPVSMKRVYDFSIPHTDNDSHRPLVVVPEPQLLPVENYITHNGDFDFYKVNGTTYELQSIQHWLAQVTHCPMPARVDSCAVAGMVDLLRTQGCFGLSARFAICLGLPSSRMEDSRMHHDFPSYRQFEDIGRVFETVLHKMLLLGGNTLSEIAESPTIRHSFALRVVSKLKSQDSESLMKPLSRYLENESTTIEANHPPDHDEESAASSSGLTAFCQASIDAFFDNDLFMTTKTFLKNAKGSFGLCITCSLDTHRQICLAARGQTVGVLVFFLNCVPFFM